MNRIKLLSIGPFEDLENRREIQREIAVERQWAGEQGGEVAFA